MLELRAKLAAVSEAVRPPDWDRGLSHQESVDFAVKAKDRLLKFVRSFPRTNGPVLPSALRGHFNN